MRLAVTAALVLTAACVGGGQRVYRVSPVEACPGQRLLEVTVSHGTIAYVYWRTPADSGARRGVLLGSATGGPKRFKVPNDGTPVFTLDQLSESWGDLAHDDRVYQAGPPRGRYLCRVPIARDSTR